jgi:hypothetical protein
LLGFIWAYFLVGFYNGVAFMWSMQKTHNAGCVA